MAKRVGHESEIWDVAGGKDVENMEEGRKETENDQYFLDR